MPLRLVLASQSPQRSTLLRQVGLDLIVQPSDVDEAAVVVPEAPQDQVGVLAQTKAAAVARRFPQCLVLGADTLVDLDGSVLGKPGDPARAKAMLCRLSGRRHRVHTGLALILPESSKSSGQLRTLQATVTSIVTMHQLGELEIEDYVQTGEPLNKAGAYGIQGYGSRLISSLSGCFTNVVGLPLCAVTNLLTQATGQPVACPANADCRVAEGGDCLCLAHQDVHPPAI